MINNKNEFVISPSKFYELLTDMGFRNYPIGSGGEKTLQLVQIKNQRISHASKEDVQLAIFRHIEKLNLGEYKHLVLDEMHKRIGRFTSDANLMALPLFDGDFLRDTETTSYFFFNNNIAEVTELGIKTIDYGDQQGYIWESEVIDHDFFPLLDKTTFHACVFSVFLDRICGGRDLTLAKTRKERLLSLMGYLLHRYRKPTLAKAVVLMDGSLDDVPNGGTGKGLVLKAISKLRKVATEDGKQFKPGASFAFQLLSPDTMVYAFDDANKKFNFEALFPLITEGVTLEKKYKDKVQIPFEDTPKVAITTNYAINGIGDSFDRRLSEFELAKYYNPKFSPADEFGHTFFMDWNPTEWNLFYNLMIEAIQIYLARGIVESASLTGNEKKLRNMLPWEFIEYVSENIALNNQYVIKDLFGHFKNNFEDFYSMKQRTFTRWLIDYSSIMGYDCLMGHSGPTRFVTFKPKDATQIGPTGRNPEMVKSF